MKWSTAMNGVGATASILGFAVFGYIAGGIIGLLISVACFGYAAFMCYAAIQSAKEP